MPTDVLRPSRRLVLGAASALPICGVAWAQGADDPVVETAGGRLRGARVGRGLAFKGVPYGAATRFRPPAPAQPWAGVRDAMAFGSIAPQVGTDGRLPPGQSEDCLVLNVYTPALDAASRPVLVFFHGGGYASGSGDRYDGGPWATREDVVIVTVNHRLNLFGFIDLTEAGPAFDGSANAGLLDMVQALKWVRANIDRFGGDPRRVTIFGQSGGGGKVSNLMATPQARGLFHRAVPMSGAVLTSLTPEQARGLTRELGRRLGLGGADLAKLADAPAATLLQAMMAMGSTGRPDSSRLNFGPTVDGAVLPHQPGDPAGLLVSADVPVMVGSTHDETRIFYVPEPGFAASTPGALQAQLAPTMKTDEATARAVYGAYGQAFPALSPADLFLTITTQYMFTRNSVLTGQRRAALGRARSFVYRFDWRSPGPKGTLLGACHALDLSLLFDTGAPSPMLDVSPERLSMGAYMRRLWTQFARTGDPNGPGLAPWAPYAAEQRPTMVLDNRSGVEDDPDPRLRALYPVLPEFHP